ncbi:glycoside hydrolase family 18 protein [Cohnella herbarum]|uniref:Glycoside hydrolase family 18 protein n=1 Tax=Cohnella herbarum TaxID=2728023 RepID=A0A7Z2VRB9_9BACL|nr:glycoside hydrolase family 18 protein [Cohnella herbarum]QJD87763.1 glycoside hydrolase family 18 protein [Cohnella herbarum]
MSKLSFKPLLIAAMALMLVSTSLIGIRPAQAATQNVAAGKTPSSNATLTNALRSTDGLSNDSNLFTEAGSGKKYIQIDFGASYYLNKIAIWHYFADSRTYKDVIVKLSDSSAFSSSVTIFNNDADNSSGQGAGTDAEYAESAAGKKISFNPVKARYLRIYSNGSSVNAYNHYVEVEAWTVDNANRSNNVTFTNPEWVMAPQTDAFIQNVIGKMNAYKIKYQMIDVGFFDKDAATGQFEDTLGQQIDGTMSWYAYDELQNWVDKSRQYAPGMKLIGVVNGNKWLHVQALPFTDRNNVLHTPSVSKSDMHDAIAAHCAFLVNYYGLDGINLDFEPVTAGTPSSDYRELIQKVRTAIGPNKNLSIDGNPFAAYMPDNEIAQFGALLDMIVMMDYDTADLASAPYPSNPSTTNETNYKLAIKENIKRISSALPASCSLIPLGPGKYSLSDSHQAYENAQSHSIAINDAIMEGARVAGSGVWWFDGSMNDATETQRFADYWINGTP